MKKAKNKKYWIMRVIIIHANPLQEVRVIKHPVHNAHLCACDAMITIPQPCKTFAPNSHRNRPHAD